jgi:hypothetical protein
MAPSNPPIAASRSATRAAFIPELQSSGPDLQDSVIAGSRAERRGAGEVSGELGYGCVDWYLYAADSTAVPIMTRRAPNE